MKSNLSPIELNTCLAIWIFTNVYILIKFYLSQTEILQDDPSFIEEMVDLQPGWSFLSRLKDTSDVEWSSYKFFIQISWPYLIVQCIVTEFIRRKEMQYLKFWYIISSMIFVTLHLGYKQLLFTLVQPFLYAAIIFSGGKKWCIWITSLALLASYNSVKYRSFFWLILEHENMYDEEVYLLLFCMPWIELRCISYCLDYIDNTKKNPADSSSKLDSLVNMMSYCLYMPILYVGPIILYEEFKKSFTTPAEKLSIRLRNFIWEICLYLLYTFLLDLALHYIYFYAMHIDIKLLRMLPALALCGGGLWMGAQFHMKYVIAYGTMTAFARLDNMEPPPTPRCIARIHIYSQMWKYFDVGLYRFLVKYVYRPSFEVISTKFKLPKTLNKMIASFSAFAFIFMWHGAIPRILVWSILNYLGVTIEHLGKAISETNKYKQFKEKVLRTDAMETRFIAILCVPLLVMSVLSNFYLFAGNIVGGLFVECISHFSITSLNTIIISGALYCCCIVSMALQDVPSRTDCKRAPAKVLA